MTFQSTHPCGVRLPPGSYNISSVYVSIHAPLRGATDQKVQLSGTIAVSIHAPLRGATWCKNAG